MPTFMIFAWPPIDRFEVDMVLAEVYPNVHKTTTLPDFLSVYIDPSDGVGLAVDIVTPSDKIIGSATEEKADDENEIWKYCTGTALAIAYIQMTVVVAACPATSEDVNRGTSTI